jgi:hypothetical protein
MTVCRKNLKQDNILHSDNIRYFVQKGRCAHGAAVRSAFASAARWIGSGIVRIVKTLAK